MIELKYFERVDFKQLINWIDSPSFILQWAVRHLRNTGRNTGTVPAFC
jgi:hypothetical protein